MSKLSERCFAVRSKASLTFKRLALTTMQRFLFSYKTTVLVVAVEHTNCDPELDHLCILVVLTEPIIIKLSILCSHTYIL